MFSPRTVLFFALSLGQFVSTATAFSPFFQQVSDAQWVIGNDVWNITISSTYGKKLFYKEKDLIGDAVGYYASTSKCFCFNVLRHFNSQWSTQGIVRGLQVSRNLISNSFILFIEYSRNTALSQTPTPVPFSPSNPSPPSETFH